jgi:hypothetical protein
VIILGSGFDSLTRATIGGLSLAGLETVNGETMKARSPSALPVGVHDVEVTRPGDEGLLDSAVLATAFTVTEVEDESDDPEPDEPEAEEPVTVEKSGCSQAGAPASGWLIGFGFALAWGRRKRS